MGGTGYCMTYYHIGREGDVNDDDDDDHAREYEQLARSQAESFVRDSHAARGKAKRKSQREFRMAAAGAADSLGKRFFFFLARGNS